MKYGIGKKASYYLISKYKPNKNNNKYIKYYLFCYIS